MTERSQLRGARLMALVLAGALLAGCGGGTPVPATEAVATYDAVAEDLLAAADTVRPMDWELQRASRGIDEPGAEDCRYRPGTWTAGQNLYPVPGQGMDWQPWRDALDPVLEEHGFDALGRERRSGGLYYVEPTVRTARACDSPPRGTWTSATSGWRRRRAWTRRSGCEPAALPGTGQPVYASTSEKRSQRARAAGICSL